MPSSLVISWRDGLTAKVLNTSTLVVQGVTECVSFHQVPNSLLNAFLSLNSHGQEEKSLSEQIARTDWASLAKWYYYLETLIRRGMIVVAAECNGSRLALLVAISPSYQSKFDRVKLDTLYSLSRFALMRSEDGQMVVESPLAFARVILLDCRMAAIVGALAEPGTMSDVIMRVGPIPREFVERLLSLLLRAGLIQDQSSHSKAQSTYLETWSFHDLLFHSRTRSGRFDAPQGATYRFAGQIPPPEARRQVPIGEGIDLFRPDLLELQRTDPPLARVQEQRKSVRTFNREQPISQHQLGEFLFRVGRVKEGWLSNLETSRGNIAMEFTKRPYPSGGGLYELELYLVINQGTSLKSGFYYYEPEGHRLIRLREISSEVNQLLSDASRSTEIPEDQIQILFILSARYSRLAWKYESIAYALILKHVGVLMQTMYLAATAMGLGSCAIGGGDSDLFARSTGTDYLSETSVGEFVLGTVQPNGIDDIRD